MFCVMTTIEFDSEIRYQKGQIFSLPRDKNKKSSPAKSEIDLGGHSCPIQNNTIRFLKIFNLT